jgi:hypothetical protein
MPGSKVRSGRAARATPAVSSDGSARDADSAPHRTSETIKPPGSAFAQDQHADLTILAKLVWALNRARSVPPLARKHSPYKPPRQGGTSGKGNTC